METLEQKSLISPWQGQTDEKIQYEEHVSIFALFVAQELVRQGKIKPEQKKEAAFEISKAYFLD